MPHNIIQLQSCSADDRKCLEMQFDCDLLFKGEVCKIFFSKHILLSQFMVHWLTFMGLSHPNILKIMPPSKHSRSTNHFPDSESLGCGYCSRMSQRVMLWDHGCALHYSVYIDFGYRSTQTCHTDRQQGKTRVNVGGAFTRWNIWVQSTFKTCKVSFWQVS